MKLLMVGTPTCSRCKSIRPRIEEYCSNHCIHFTYKHVHELSDDEKGILFGSGVNAAPAFLLYRDNTTVNVIVGDDIFLELI